MNILVPWRRPSRSEVRRFSRPQGTNFETETFKFRWFLDPPTKTSYITPHYYPKYKVQAIEFVLWDDHFFPFCLTIFHFREFTNLKHHINQQHSQVRSLQWNIAVFQTKTLLDIFALLHCPTTHSTMLQLKKYKCGDCGYSCYLKTDLERHITNVHEKVCKIWSRPFDGSKFDGSNEF